MFLDDDVRQNLQHSHYSIVWVWCRSFRGKRQCFGWNWETKKWSCALLLSQIAKRRTAHRNITISIIKCVSARPESGMRIEQSTLLFQLHFFDKWGTCLEWTVACIVLETLLSFLRSCGWRKSFVYSISVFCCFQGVVRYQCSSAGIFLKICCFQSFRQTLCKWSKRRCEANHRHEESSV